MIPNVLHFVFGMAKDFGGKPFSLSHYLAIKSAVETNKPETSWFHYEYEPSGEWWQKAKPLLTLNKIKAPEKFMGRPIFHVAHKADVVRLLSLNETGGIYLDLDTICVRPLTPLLGYTFVIGEEFSAPYQPKNFRQKMKYYIRKKTGRLNKQTETSTGLCNAVLLSEKKSDFISRWLQEYKTFRSAGRDKYWNEHSVRIPQQLAKDYPETVKILGPYSFHYPLYNKQGLYSMFEEVTEFPDAYLHHLWESFSWDQYLSKLTVEDILTKPTTYNLIARKYFENIQ